MTMVRRIPLAVASLALVAAPSAVSADTAGYRIKATVAMHCKVQHRFDGFGQKVAGGISLGELREYCNAAHGYELVVSYTPGSLRGTTLRAGSDEVVLNGSGEAILSRSTGPRILERAVTATPGESGFDTDRIQFSRVGA